MVLPDDLLAGLKVASPVWMMNQHQFVKPFLDLLFRATAEKPVCLCHKKPPLIEIEKAARRLPLIALIVLIVVLHEKESTPKDAHRVAICNALCG